MRRATLLEVIHRTLPALPLLLGLAVLACDSASPVAPSGTLLSVSANPSTISLNGSAQITIEALRSSGIPVTPGTEIRLSTTLGTVPAIVTTDERGLATAVLQGDGRGGTATVSARSGAAEAATVDVQIGFAAATLALTTSPTVVAESGGRINLTAVVLDDQGQPLVDVVVLFSSPIGRLDSGTGAVRTNASGIARDSLRVEEAELSAVGNSFTVSATTTSGGASASDTATVTVTGPPVADFTFAVQERVVAFTDTSSGNPTSWQWDFESDGIVDSTLQNPTHVYDSSGGKLVTLVVANAFGSSSRTKQVVIPNP